MASDYPLSAAAPPKRQTFGLPVIVLIALGLAGAGVVTYLELAPRKPVADAPLTPEARAYVGHLKLADVNMKAAKNYFSQMVVEISGNITNAGDRNLDTVEINCVFQDYYGQVALRQRVPIVSPKMGGSSPAKPKTSACLSTIFARDLESENAAARDCQREVQLMAIILLVDDDPGGLEIRKMLLERDGHRVFTAADVTTARARFHELAPECVILDLRLPSPEDGLALVREFREAAPDLRIVVLAGWSADLEGRPERTLVDEVLAKPVRSERLVRR